MTLIDRSAPDFLAILHWKDLMPRFLVQNTGKMDKRHRLPEVFRLRPSASQLLHQSGRLHKVPERRLSGGCHRRRNYPREQPANTIRWDQPERAGYFERIHTNSSSAEFEHPQQHFPPGPGSGISRNYPTDAGPEVLQLRLRIMHLPRESHFRIGSPVATRRAPPRNLFAERHIIVASHRHARLRD